MTNPFRYLLALLAFAPLFAASAQDELLDELAEPDTTVTPVSGTFKGVRVINSASTDLQPKGELLFLITHRFGTINSGFKGFWGLDDARIRIGLEYGINDRWVVGIGRSGELTTFDGYSRLKLLRQSTGARNMPISVVWNANMAYRDQDFAVPGFAPKTSDKLFFTQQLLISRKFSPRLSLQLAPTFTHQNVREFEVAKHDMWYLGLSGRVKITKRMALLFDYYYHFHRDYLELFSEPLAFAWEIETGGHVFQLVFSNSQGMSEPLFLTRTTGKWGQGDIHFGFNISRTFPMKRHQKKS
jgi:hypothetical protein